MNSGIIVWFNQLKGYGFVRESYNQEEYFVHKDNVHKPHVKYLAEGVLIDYDIYENPKGKEAKNVVVVF